MADMLLLIMSCVHLVNGLLLAILGMVDRFDNIAKLEKLAQLQRSAFDEHYIAMPVWVGVLAMTASILGVLIASRRITRYKMQMAQVFKTLSIVALLISFLILMFYIWNLSSLALWINEKKRDDYIVDDPALGKKMESISKSLLDLLAAIVTLCVLELAFCSFSIVYSSAHADAAGGAYQMLNTNNAAAAPNTEMHSVPASGIPHMMMDQVQQTVPVAGLQSPQA